MEYNRSRFKLTAALILIFTGMAVLASCTGQNSLIKKDSTAQAFEKTKKKSDDADIKEKNDKTEAKKSNILKDYYMAVPADVFYEKKGVLILDKNFQDKKYLPDIEIKEPFLISKDNIYAKDSYNLCPGIYSLKDEDWVYKADKLYNMSDLGQGLTLFNTNDVWYYYDDSDDIEKIKEKYGDIVPEGNGEDNYIVNEKGKVLFNLPGGTTQRFGDYIWATVIKKADDTDIKDIGINIYDLKGNLINSITADEEGSLYFDNAYEEPRLNDNYVIVNKFNDTKKNYIEHKILYSPAGDEVFDLFAAMQEFVGKSGKASELYGELEAEMDKDILLIEFYSDKEDRYYSILYNCKSKSLINQTASQQHSIKFKTAGKSFIILQLEDGSYNIFEDGVLKRTIPEEEAKLLKADVLLGEADMPLSINAEASTETDLVLYDVVRGEELHFKHNNQLKASDFENRLIYLTELSSDCNIITLRNKGEGEEAGKNYLTDKEILFYKNKYIAQGIYVSHQQEANIKRSDGQGKDYTYITVSTYNSNPEMDSIVFQGFLIDKKELVELNPVQMESKIVMYYGENFYICLHGSSIECYNLNNKLLRREYKNYDEENISYY